jgi:dolichyl-phosphate-mannose--protein O-mannosyl transferase
LTAPARLRSDTLVRFFAAVAIFALIVLHQDWWNWRAARPFVLGLPVGLWYHAMYTVAAAGLMALLVRYFWPEDNQD